jgi:hypothetical protein
LVNNTDIQNTSNSSWPSSCPGVFPSRCGKLVWSTKAADECLRTNWYLSLLPITMRTPVRLPKHCTETAKRISPKRRIMGITGMFSICQWARCRLWGLQARSAAAGGKVEAPRVDLTADLGGVKRLTLLIRNYVELCFPTISFVEGF